MRKFPESFYCPISGEVMKDAVIDREGNSYDREEITTWLLRSSTSPITRNRLKLSHLAPNRALQSLIDEAVAKSGSSSHGPRPAVSTLNVNSEAKALAKENNEIAKEGNNAPKPVPIAFTKVIFARKAASPTEITIEPGQIIAVIRKDVEWWLGAFVTGEGELSGNKMGFFPGNYTEEMSEAPLFSYPTEVDVTADIESTASSIVQNNNSTSDNHLFKNKSSNNDKENNSNDNDSNDNDSDSDAQIYIGERTHTINSLTPISIPTMAMNNLTPIPISSKDLTDMKRFLLSPIPKANGMVECELRRFQGGLGDSSRLFPIFHLYIKEGGRFRFLLSSKKRTFNASSNYSISMSHTDQGRYSESFLGKLRAVEARDNTNCTRFKVFDNGVNPEKIEGVQAVEGPEGAKARCDLVDISYHSNRNNMPRKMDVLIPLMTSASQSTRDDSAISDDLTTEAKKRFVNKTPTYNAQVRSYVLNFNGRCTRASVKNFMLVEPKDDNEKSSSSETMLLFGASDVDRNRFNLDMRWPLSPIQAFGIALSAFAVGNT